MALARLAFMPPELKLETYHHLEFDDLFALSHVSQFWRSLVLADRRWTAWFDMLRDSGTCRNVETALSGFKMLGTISKRDFVNLCFSSKCSACSKYTPTIFLPLLKRLCNECLHLEKPAVLSLTSAIARYDLNENDITTAGIVVLYIGSLRVRLVSESAVEKIAIEKHGGAANLATHLQTKRARLLANYQARVGEYDTVHTERARLKAAGDLAGAAAVTLKNNKPLPKTRPQMPAILKTSPTPPFYKFRCTLSTNYLAVDTETGCVGPHSLVKCTICIIIAELRANDRGGGPEQTAWMPSSAVVAHEQREHRASRDAGCWRREGDDELGICEGCLNRAALEMLEDDD
ncbi:hypothetical protein C8R43DRAFT_612455 [Mycena crocata]|nr:hypothetical protein C8R43DRAFT_612455 [Mycena crocata]